MSSTTNTLVKVIVAVLAVALIAGVIGIIYKFTNGFNEDFKTFYIEYAGEQILTADTNKVFKPNVKHRFDVKYTFDGDDAEPKDYSVKVVPYFTKDFEFTVADKTSVYSKAKELTDAFDIKKHDTYFELTVTETQTLINVLSSIYDSGAIVVPSDLDENNKYLYSLVIASYNGNVKYNIHFSIEGVSNNGKPVTGEFDITDVVIDPDGIVFTGGS